MKHIIISKNSYNQNNRRYFENLLQDFHNFSKSSSTNLKNKKYFVLKLDFFPNIKYKI